MARRGASLNKIHAVRSATSGKFVNKNSGSSKNTIRPSSHVVYGSNGWVVRKSESARASRVFETKDKAVGYAKRLAKKEESRVVIHRKDGSIAAIDSYSQE